MDRVGWAEWSESHQDRANRWDSLRSAHPTLEYVGKPRYLGKNRRARLFLSAGQETFDLPVMGLGGIERAANLIFDSLSVVSDRVQGADLLNGVFNRSLSVVRGRGR